MVGFDTLILPFAAPQNIKKQLMSYQLILRSWFVIILLVLSSVWDFSNARRLFVGAAYAYFGLFCLTTLLDGIRTWFV